MFWNWRTVNGGELFWREIMKKGLILIPALLINSLGHSAGFDDKYKAHTGDLTGDGRVDIYLKHTPNLVMVPFGDMNVPIATSRREVGDFLLEQNPNSTFTVRTLTQTDKTQVLGWEESPALTVESGDFNADGIDDVLVKEIASLLGSSNQKDQMIFAPAQAGGLPSQLTIVTSDFQRMMDDIRQWYIDPTYFEVTSQDIGNFYYFGHGYDAGGLHFGLTNCEADPRFAFCVWFHDDLNILFSRLFGLNCFAYLPTQSNDDPNEHCLLAYHVFGVTNAAVTIQDFSSTLTEVENIVMTTQDIGSGAATIEDVIQIVESTIGVSIGGMDFAEIIEDDYRLSDPNVQRNYELQLSLFHIWNVLFLRRPLTADHVFVTGHKFFWYGPIHTALEYTYPGTQTRVRHTVTVSASQNGLGLLEAKENRRSDRFNPALGVATPPPTHTTPESYFDAIRAASNRYDNGLAYGIPPIQPGGPFYNSNGYINGLIICTNGTSTFNLDNTVGGNAPVPCSEF